MSLSSNIKAKVEQHFKGKKKREEVLARAEELKTKSKTDQTLWDELLKEFKK